MHYFMTPVLLNELQVSCAFEPVWCCKHFKNEKVSYELKCTCYRNTIIVMIKIQSQAFVAWSLVLYIILDEWIISTL